MGIILHDLAFQDDLRPSPYCWRVRLALEHKGLGYDTKGTPFTGIPTVAGGGHKTVPVLEDLSRPEKQVVIDSWAIANYLEDTYPDRPSLFGNAASKDAVWCYALNLQGWMMSGLMLQATKVLVTDAFARIQPQDRDHFRVTREKRFGMSIEAFASGPLEDRIAVVRNSLEPVRAVVKQRPFLAGQEPTYADYAVAGLFFWWRALSPTRLLEDGDPLSAWFGRVLNLYPRIARESARTWQGP